GRPDLDRSARLERALQALPAEQRAVVALKIDGGLTFAEAAACLSTWARLGTMFHGPCSVNRLDPFGPSGPPADLPAAAGAGPAGDGPPLRRWLVPAAHRPAPGLLPPDRPSRPPRLQRPWPPRPLPGPARPGPRPS